MDKSPHTAVILIKYTTHEVDNNNFLSAKPTTKGSKLFQFNGDSLDDVQQKVDKFIEQIGELYGKETSEN